MGGTARSRLVDRHASLGQGRGDIPDRDETDSTPGQVTLQQSDGDGTTYEDKLAESDDE
jgi:hypothetical protein